MPAEALRVEVVYCPQPGVNECVPLLLHPGAVLGDALLASGLLKRHGLVLAGLPVGIWGRQRDADAALQDRDRVEIYRPLRVDPKDARRLRQQRQQGQQGQQGQGSQASRKAA